MKTETGQWLFILITAFTAVIFVAAGSFADTRSALDETNSGHMIQPGLHGGMGIIQHMTR